MSVSTPNFIDLDSWSAVIKADGRPSYSLTSNREPNHDDIVGYMALLLTEGFEVDTNAASSGWFVRGGLEWVAFLQPASAEYMRAGDFSVPDLYAGSFVVTYTQAPVSIAGYCRITEAGGDRCRQ